jgi:hypothetical protein
MKLTQYIELKDVHNYQRHIERAVGFGNRFFGQPLNSGHFYGVQRVVPVHRFDCT